MNALDGEMSKRSEFLLDAKEFKTAESALAEVSRLEEEYFEGLPVVPLSCCPFDGKPLFRSFDAFGLDGFWWRSDASPREVSACPHFCFLRGAWHFGNANVRGGAFEAHPGPEVPYVIPRILALEGVVAVVSKIDLLAGQSAYPIAYFAERVPPPQLLTSGWARTVYCYETQLGEGNWRMPDDAWDFDLRPWAEKGKIRWCDPGKPDSLSGEPVDRCPYFDVPGERQSRVVRLDRSGFVSARG